MSACTDDQRCSDPRRKGKDARESLSQGARAREFERLSGLGTNWHARRAKDSKVVVPVAQFSREVRLFGFSASNLEDASEDFGRELADGGRGGVAESDEVGGGSRRGGRRRVEERRSELDEHKADVLRHELAKGAVVLVRLLRSRNGGRRRWCEIEWSGVAVLSES